MGASSRPPSTPEVRSRTILGYLESQGLAGAALQTFLSPRLADLSSPKDMLDREPAAERISRAILSGESIVVFGDYDCDGMTATAILSDALEQLGARVDTALASRFDGGYGFSERALARVLDLAPGLLITCDCGSSDHATLAQLARRGVDVIVVDHHLVPEQPLPALAFLNPHRPGCGFAFKHLASCGLVFLLAAAVREKLSRVLDLRPLLDLVAIGSIADVVPLTGDNRALVRAGLLRLASPERPGLRALCELLEFPRGEPVTAGDVAFRLAPRLNAPGRLGAPDLALSLLREKDLVRARELALRIEDVCQARRKQQDAILEQAEQEIVQGRYLDDPALVLGSSKWNHGIVGIVAGRLADKYDRPVVVVGFEAGLGSGSVRGPAGMPLYDAVASCRAHLVRFGGHQAACGLTVQEAKLAALRGEFVDFFRHYQPTSVAPQRAALDLVPGDDLRQVLSDLYLLEPCGEGNPAPLLRIPARVLSKRALRGGHLKLELEAPGSGRVGAFAPGLGELLDDLGSETVVRGSLRPDRFRGGDALELLVVAVEPGAG